LIILLGLKSMGMELSALIALLRRVPITYVWMISPYGIVHVRKGIILTLGLSIECSINCISLFNVIFVGHISEACPCKEYILQTFTYCTLPQAKERTREVRSLTLFSRLEKLTSLTHLLGKSPHVPNCFGLAAIFEINWRATSSVLSTNAPPFAASMILQSIGISPS